MSTNLNKLNTKLSLPELSERKLRVEIVIIQRLSITHWVLNSRSESLQCKVVNHGPPLHLLVQHSLVGWLSIKLFMLFIAHSAKRWKFSSLFSWQSRQIRICSLFVNIAKLFPFAFYSNLHRFSWAGNAFVRVLGGSDDGSRFDSVRKEKKSRERRKLNKWQTYIARNSSTNQINYSCRTMISIWFVTCNFVILCENTICLVWAVLRMEERKEEVEWWATAASRQQQEKVLTA